MKYDPVNAHCPICGKFFVTMWKDFYVYRRGSTFYCSENCMLVDLTRDMKLISEVKDRRRLNKMQKITLEQKKKAVEIAVSGKSPLEYLKKCGSKAPDKTWYTIKTALKEKDPETYAKIPDFRKQASSEMIQENAKLAEQVMENIKEYPPTVKLTGPIMIETPEGNVVHKVEVPEQRPDDGLKKPLDRIVGPCHIDKFLITAIKHPNLGEFYYDKKFEAVDWRTAEGEEISMSPSGWNSLLKDLPHILRILGASR